MKNQDNLKKIALLSLIFLMEGTCTLNAQNRSEDNNNAGIFGTDCSAFGYESLFNNTSTGIDNSALGWHALYSNTTGDRNTAAGSEALLSSNGDDNTAVGYRALQNNAGDRNTAVGVEALINNAGGNENTAVGYQALLTNMTGNNNTAIGAYADVPGSGDNNQTVIGYMALPSTTGGDIVTIGSTAITLFECMVNYTTSDRRIKNNIRYDEVKGLAFINKLRPVVYNLNTRKQTDFMTRHMTPERKAIYMGQDFGPSMAMRRSGFIAQEVEAAAKACGYDFSGVVIPADPEKGMYRLSYSTFVVPIVKAVQEQQDMIEAMQKQITHTEQLIAAGASVGIKSSTGPESFRMEANRPNPFSHETIINYHLPTEITEAYLVISDLSGKQIVSYPITNKGTSSITISAENLSAGIYLYSITGDNQTLGTRRMVVTGK